MRPFWTLFLLGPLIACGRVGFRNVTGDADVDGAMDAALPDGAPLDSMAMDTAIDAPAPDASTLGPFGTPIPLVSLNSAASDFDPSMTDDLLEIYFITDRSAGSIDVWRSTRVRATDRWPAPGLAGVLSSSSGDLSPRVSGDGLTFWLASNRPGGLGGHDIWMSTRDSRADVWTPPVHVPELSSPANDYSPTVTADGLIAFIDSDRDGAAQLYEARRASTSDPFGTPTPVAELNALAVDVVDPWISPDGLTLYFSLGAGGALDIQVATRSDRGSPFEMPADFPELHVTDRNTDSWFSPNGRVVAFSAAPTGLPPNLYSSLR